MRVSMPAEFRSTVARWLHFRLAGTGPHFLRRFELGGGRFLGEFTGFDLGLEFRRDRLQPGFDGDLELLELDGCLRAFGVDSRAAPP